MNDHHQVLLINMPFGVLNGPCLGLSLLKAGLSRNGISSRICYFNLRFANLIGAEDYTSIASESATSDLLGEWLFSHTLFGHKTRTACRAYINTVLAGNTFGGGVVDDSGWTREYFEELIRKVPPLAEVFLEECLEDVLSREPRVVGFSSVFQQQVAALSLAKRIKELRPNTGIVFGGANCEGVMGQELLRQFPYVDVVVSGEGDVVFPNIVRTLITGAKVRSSSGVYSRLGQALPAFDDKPSNTEMVVDMDSLPVPDFDDYFKACETANLSKTIKPVLLVETSRGCWWGEKHHCTFCGLNGQNMRYRSKTPKRVLSELTLLSDKYPGLTFQVVDNILDMAYFKEFLPLLVRQQPGFKFFYEVKANLTKSQLKTLHAAGVEVVQPGIESLSDQVLAIMDKGVRGLQNIQFLKWCAEVGIKPVWNLIFGFPGESEQEYGRMAEVIPLLSHLMPPGGYGRIRTDRFSPNFDRAEELGFTNVRPCEAYKHVYPFSAESIGNLATYFVFDYQAQRDVNSYAAPVVAACTEWKKSAEKSRLYSIPKGNRLLIWDSRPVAKRNFWILTGLDRNCYLACDEARSVAHIHRELLASGNSGISQSDVRRSLNSLCEARLAICQGDIYLALAVEQVLSETLTKGISPEASAKVPLALA
jgi:ribosomal peptide maturation radical SAM protein 1